MNAVPLLHTARTVMTVPSPDCAPQLAAWRRANRAHLAPWEPERTDAWFSEEAARVRLEQALDEAHAGSALHFIAFDRIDMAIVATCSFTNIVRGVFQACHLGFAVSAAHQGTGLMQEVAAAGIAHLFDAEGLHRVMACHLPANDRSAALLQRLGFEREGLARSYLRIAGQWQDMVLTSLINPR